MRSLEPLTEVREPEPTGGALPTVTLGFIPLTDCAVLVVARALGFAASEGIDLRLVREVSWANIRDKVALGLLNGAQMLAGMPIAATLGINQAPMRMLAPFCLNRNGNAISVSQTLYAELAEQGNPDAGAAEAGRALARVIAARRASGASVLTFGMVYPFSCHNYELRYWMAASGINPDADVRLVVIPPPLMVGSLRAGHVDGFCVGEPWNSLAVEAGLGRIIASKAELWRRGVEKVLCVPQRWAEENPEVLAALVRALDRAAAWAEHPQNRARLADLLAGPAYLDLPPAVILRALAGEMVTGPGDEPRRVDDFLILHRERANDPSVAQALWIYAQMVRWGQIDRRPGDEARVRAVFRPDIYRAALAGLPWLPDTANRTPDVAALDGTVFFDGRPFDPTRIDAYLAEDRTSFGAGNAGRLPNP